MSNKKYFNIVEKAVDNMKYKIIYIISFLILLLVYSDGHLTEKYSFNSGFFDGTVFVIVILLLGTMIVKFRKSSNDN